VCSMHLVAGALLAPPRGVTLIGQERETMGMSAADQRSKLS